MHIHISKNAFSTIHLYKFLQFFTANPKFIFTISQRKNTNELRQWAALDSCDDESVIYKAKYKMGGPERHVAVNVSNPTTVEVRVFKGTLNPMSFWKNIEFCEALLHFTNQCSIADLTVEKFTAFVTYNRKKYGNLCNFLNDKAYRLLAKGD
jgi:hypothetical protein